MATSKEQTIDSALDPANEGPPAPTKEENDYLTGMKLFVTMASITVVGFLLLLDVSVVTTAIPKITTHFHSLNDVGWYGSAYLLANCALQPLTGKIYSEFNLKSSFLFFFGIFEIGSLICGVATSSTMLIIGRAIAGMGGSGIINGGYNIIHAIAPLPKQPLLMGILIGVSQVGILCGPLIGGALTEYASWRWCFYINLPIGGLAALNLLFIPVPASRNTAQRTISQRLLKLDPIGFLLFAPAAIQLILALQWGGINFPWNSATIIGLFCGSFGTLLVFLAWAHRMGKEAMIPLALISKRIIWCSCVNYAFFIGSMLSATYYLPIYFQSVKNASPLMSGVDLLPSILATVFATVAGGAIIGKVGYYLPFGVASSAIVLLASGLISTFTPTTSVGIWIGYQIIMGIGRGMGFQIPILAVQNNSAKEDVSIVNALVVFSQNLGGAIFLSFDQLIFSTRLRHYLAVYAPEVNSQLVIAAGATGFRDAVPETSLAGVILAYSKSFDQVMYLAAGVSGVAMIVAFGMGWVNIKKKADPKGEKVNSTASTSDVEDGLKVSSE